jgi:hypothetical protein
VTDPSDAVIRDANVELKDNVKGTTLSTKTNAEGVYIFSLLLPSRYTLTIAHPGFQTTKRVLTVFLGPPATLNVQLAIASASTTVNVTEERQLIQAENGDASTTMNRVQVSELPNPGNDLVYIAQTAPGAIMNTDGGTGNFSLLGMPGTSNLFTVNGMSDNDDTVRVNDSGASNLLLGQNQIQEATVVANGYSGQFGGAAGANVNYITKSGGNEYHGNAVYFWNGRVFNANDWMNSANGTPRPFDIANQWAGSIGGPIKKDKMFFFFDTEGLRVLLPTPVQVVLPSSQFEAATLANIDTKFGANSASDAFYKQIFTVYNESVGAGRATGGASFTDPLGCQGFLGPNGLGTNVPCAIHFQKTIGEPTDETIISGRLDWNIGHKDRVFLRVQYDGGHQASYTDPISPLFDAGSDQPWWQGQLNETHTFGPSEINQLLIAGTWFSAVFSQKNPSQSLAAFPTVLTWNYPFTTLGGENVLFPEGEIATRYQISDDFVKTRSLHKFGFGAKFERRYLSNFNFSQYKNGLLIPLSLDAFYQGGIDPNVLDGSDSTDYTTLVQTFPSVTEERFASHELGLYAQDEWRTQRNLTLTFALRAEHQSNPTCARRCFARLMGPFESVSHDPAQPYNQAILIDQKQALENTDSIVWAPRLSFAWQPAGVSHDIVVRGGIGIFYDPRPNFVAEDFAKNPPLVNAFDIQGYNLTPGESNSLFKVAAQSNASFLNGFASGATLAQIQSSDPFFFPPHLRVPNRKTHSPQYQKWSLQVQQTLGTTTSVTVGYFGHHGIHDMAQNPSANAFGFGSFPTGQCASPPVLPCADPRFGKVTEFTTASVSNYHGMVASFQHRFSRWSQGLFQANYTYGHALDEVSNGGIFQFTPGSSSPYLQDPNNPRDSYGPADYDVRHSFNANYVWELPLKAALGGHGPDYLVKGWQISGTIFARTGFPYTVGDLFEMGNLNSNNFFGAIYSVPVGPLSSGSSCGEGAAAPLAPHPCLPPQMLPDGSPSPGALFLQAGCETGFNTGNLGPSGVCGGPSVSFRQGRNRFRGPGYFSSDFTVLKNTRIPGWENATLGIGFQFFNVLNHPNFGLPNSDSSGGGFGQIGYMEQPPTGILGVGLGGDTSARMIQLKVRLQF